MSKSSSKSSKIFQVGDRVMLLTKDGDDDEQDKTKKKYVDTTSTTVVSISKESRKMRPYYNVDLCRLCGKTCYENNPHFMATRCANTGCPVMYCCPEHQKTDWDLGSHRHFCRGSNTKSMAGTKPIDWHHLHGRIRKIHNDNDNNNQKYSIDLDLLPYPSASITVPIHCIQKEGDSLLLKDDETSNNSFIIAPINQYGVLLPEEATVLNMIFDFIRVVTAKVFLGDPTIQQVSDIHKLRMVPGPLGIMKINAITMESWKYWKDGRGCPNAPPNIEAAGNTSIAGVYMYLRKLLLTDIPQANGPAHTSKPSYQRCMRAVVDPQATRSWHVRIQNNFWIVGMDQYGTFLIPDDNHRVVYQCVGTRDPIWMMIASRQQNSNPPRPILMACTLLPWYGRIVHDGILVPAPATSQTQVRQPIYACDALKSKLEASVQRAKDEGRVIQKFMQLEVKGGSLAGLHDKLLKPVLAPSEPPPSQQQQAPKKAAAAAAAAAASSSVPQNAPPSRDKARSSVVPSAQTLQSPPTKEEEQLINVLKEIPKTTIPEIIKKDPKRIMPPHAMWIFRRFGMTEKENPKHGGMIMAGPRPVMPFKCHKGIKPCPTDILKPLVNISRKLKKCPAMVWVDDAQCATRVQFLLSNVKGIGASYYNPPDKDEQKQVIASMAQFDKNYNESVKQMEHLKHQEGGKEGGATEAKEKADDDEAGAKEAAASANKEEGGDDNNNG